MTVSASRAPDAPSGCPSAMAPPFTFVRSRSSPRSFSTARYCVANASLISTRSMSSTLRPARPSAWRLEGAGPMPMMSGSTPQTPPETMRAMGLRPARRGPVVDPARVAGRHGASLLEAGLEPGELLERRVGADVLVLVHREGRLLGAHLDRD